MKTLVKCSCGATISLRKDGTMRRHVKDGARSQRTLSRVDRLCSSTEWRELGT